MGTKTIGVTDEVYDRLVAEKRDDESFTDTIARLIDTATSDWRHGFGRYRDDDGREFEHIVEAAGESHADGLARRQDDVLEAMGFELGERGNLVSVPDDRDEGR